MSASVRVRNAQLGIDRDVGREGVLALQKLPFGERRARLGQRHQLGRIVVAGQLREGTGEEQVPGGHGHLATGRGRDRGVSAP